MTTRERRPLLDVEGAFCEHGLVRYGWCLECRPRRRLVQVSPIAYQGVRLAGGRRPMASALEPAHTALWRRCLLRVADWADAHTLTRLTLLIVLLAAVVFGGRVAAL